MAGSKSLRGIYSFVRERAGKEGLKVVKAIGEGATDEIIEGKTNFEKVSEIRHLLNVLHDEGMVKYTREKNMETGWFTYTWYFNVDNTVKKLLEAKHKELTNVNARLAEEDTKEYYHCAKQCKNHSFEEAFDTNFKCSQCNCKLKPETRARKSKRLKELQLKMDSLSQIIQEHEPELNSSE